MIIFFFFVRAWAFFTMRDKVKTLPSRLPFVKRERNRVFFFLFFFLWKSDVIWKEREIICIVFYCTVNVRMFFSRYAIIYGLWHVSCEDKWQLDWIVFFFLFFVCDFSWNGTREIFFFNRRVRFILNVRGVQDATLGVEFFETFLLWELRLHHI